MNIWLLALLAITQGESTSQTTQWVLGQSEIRPSEILHAWVIIRKPPPTSAILQLVSDPKLSAWFANGANGCTGATRPSSQSVLKGHSAPLAVCVKGDSEGKWRVLANYTPAGGATETSASDVITVQAPSLSSVFLALISSVTGLVAGILTMMVQNVVTRRTARREAESKVTSQIVTRLLPQLRQNLATLRAHRDGTRPTNRLELNGWDALENDNAILGFLSKGERHTYLERLHKLALETEAYNTHIDQKRFPEAEADRDTLIPQLETWIGKAEVKGG